jgi:hypothetical protein
LPISERAIAHLEKRLSNAIASDARTLAIALTKQVDELDTQVGAENVLPLKFLLNLSIFPS